MKRLGRILYSVIRRLLPLLPGWRNTRVRVIVINDHNQVLLIRSWLSRQLWSLPGGGVESNETQEAAASRELQEETGIICKSELFNYISTVHDSRLRAELAIYAVYVDSPQLPALRWPHSWEIIERQWHDLGALPPELSDYAKDAITLAFSDKN